MESGLSGRRVIMAKFFANLIKRLFAPELLQAQADVEILKRERDWFESLWKTETENRKQIQAELKRETRSFQKQTEELTRELLRIGANVHIGTRETLKDAPVPEPNELGTEELNYLLELAEGWCKQNLDEITPEAVSQKFEEMKANPHTWLN